MAIKKFNFNLDKWDTTHQNPYALKDYAEDFLKDLQGEEYFTYEDQFFPDYIQSVFSDINCIVEYCPPASLGYKTFGCQTMRIINPVSEKDQIKNMMGNKNIIDEITIIDDIAIVKVPSPVIDDFYTKKFYYQSLSKKDDKWILSSKISFSLDEQILISLGIKYKGNNSQFSDFASKMLGIA